MVPHFVHTMHRQIARQMVDVHHDLVPAMMTLFRKAFSRMLRSVIGSIGWSMRLVAIVGLR
jgi:hypothetical protein